MMLDVVLYGYDPDGRLTLEERPFASLRDLALFFSSGEVAGWAWAEVHVHRQDGTLRVVRYSASDLRALIKGRNPNPSRN